MSEQGFDDTLAEHGPSARAREAIYAEREYQLRRWGREHDQQHTPEEWQVILSVYAGKVASTVKPYTPDAKLEAFRKRVKQLGAICVAVLEATDSEPAPKSHQ